MNFSLTNKTASLSVGEFAGFALGPHEAGGGGAQGLWRAQLGQHWHNELQKRTLAESPAAYSSRSSSTDASRTAAGPSCSTAASTNSSATPCARSRA